MKAMKTCRLPSPLGEMLLVANPDGTALAGLYLASQKYFPDAARWDDAPQLPLFRVAAVQLREYFAGARTTFDLPLEPAGTPFQRQVWAAIAVVPFAATITYGELAARCGAGVRRASQREMSWGRCWESSWNRLRARNSIDITTRILAPAGTCMQLLRA